MYNKDSPTTIQEMFNSIAHRYDFTNEILSLRMHKKWNRALVTHVLAKDVSAQTTFVDLCAGTGDITFNYLERVKSNCQAFLVDFSSEMLDSAKKKAAQRFLNHSLSYIEADVQKVPLQSQVANCITIAYGIRNVQNPALCIQEAYRILKPGGCFGILELTRPNNTLLRFGHTIYLKTLLPLLGKLATDNKQAYQYLCNSIQTFIPPQKLFNLLNENGFEKIEKHLLLGGIATIFIAYKP